MELEIWTWNYLYTDRKWHYIWAEEVAGISTYWEEQRTWAVALGRRSNLGVVKTIRIFKRKGKGCSRGENRREWSKNKKQPSFSGSADAFPPILLPKPSPWLHSSCSIYFFLSELISFTQLELSPQWWDSYIPPSSSKNFLKFQFWISKSCW